MPILPCKFTITIKFLILLTYQWCALWEGSLMTWHAINIPVVCSLRGSLIMWHAINIPVVRSRWKAVYQTALTQDTACCQYGHSLCGNKVETMAHYKYIYLLQGDVTRHIYYVGDFLVMHNNIITPQSWHQVVCSKTTKKGRHMYIIMGIINPLHPMHLRRFRKWRFCTMLIQCVISTWVQALVVRLNQ